jgi:Glycosyl hydrolase family 12
VPHDGRAMVAIPRSFPSAAHRCLVTLGLLAACLQPGRVDANVVRTCDPFGTVTVADGRFIVQQNEWNSSVRQCVRVEGRSWRITRASFDLATDGPPATYPSIFSGCHWGTCTRRGPLPIRVDELARMRSTWRTDLPSDGAFNVAYDIWTNSSASMVGRPDGSEIMIWLAKRGRVRPAGSVVGRVRIDGTAWDVWTARMPSWNYVAYVRRRGTPAVEDLNLRAFVRDSVRRGATAPSWYVIAVEAGFEIWRGGRALSTLGFRFGASSLRSAP